MSAIDLFKKFAGFKGKNVAEEIIKFLSGEMKFERGLVIYFLNGEFESLYQSEGLENKIREEHKGLFSEMRENNQSVLTNLILDSSNYSALAVPLMDGEKSVGLIYLDSKVNNKSFSEKDMKMLEEYVLVITPILMLNILKAEKNAFREKLVSVTEELKEIREEFSEQIRDIKNDLDIAYLELKKRYQIGNIVGVSDSIKEIHGEIQNLSPLDSPVLLLGENGTGKELIAKTIHYQSRRFESPFRSIDCYCVSPLVAKEEFLGKKGLFEIAGSGTVYLKNIDQLNMSAQKIIYETIKSKTFKGRVISSSTSKEGIYPDLFKILSSNSIYIHPLKDRVEDIKPICSFILREISEESGEIIKEISEDTIKIMVKYSWPNNVAELEEELRKSAILCDKVIGPEHISEKIKHPAGLPEMIFASEMEGKTLDQAVHRIERELVRSTLKKVRGNKAKTAKLLGISRTTLYEILSEEE